jgi:hypothetical protein
LWFRGHPYDLGRIYETNVCELDRPEMNSVRDACRGCKAEKPIFLLFRLVESKLETAAGPISSQSCKRHGLGERLQIADLRLRILDWSRDQTILQSETTI